MVRSSLIDIYAVLIQIFLVKPTVLLSGFYLPLQAANHKQEDLDLCVCLTQQVESDLSFATSYKKLYQRYKAYG